MFVLFLFFVLFCVGVYTYLVILKLNKVSSLELFEKSVIFE